MLEPREYALGLRPHGLAERNRHRVDNCLDVGECGSHGRRLLELASLAGPELHALKRREVRRVVLQLVAQLQHAAGSGLGAVEEAPAAADYLVVLEQRARRFAVRSLVTAHLRLRLLAPPRLVAA